MSGRDYAAEMRAVIDAETGEGPYVSRVAAEHVVEKLRATDPDLLAGWLNAQAEHFVWQAINDRDRSTRASARASARPRAFAEDAATEDPAERKQRIVRWLNVPFATEDGSRKRLADMKKADLLFAGDAYEARANENKLTAAFLRAIARKVGTATVADKYSDEQLTSMWTSLVGE